MTIKLLIDKGEKMKAGTILPDVFRNTAIEMIAAGEAEEVTPNADVKAVLHLPTKRKPKDGEN